MPLNEFLVFVVVVDEGFLVCSSLCFKREEALRRRIHATALSFQH